MPTSTNLFLPTSTNLFLQSLNASCLNASIIETCCWTKSNFIQTSKKHKMQIWFKLQKWVGRHRPRRGVDLTRLHLLPTKRAQNIRRWLLLLMRAKEPILMSRQSNNLLQSRSKYRTSKIWIYLNTKYERIFT